MTQKFHIVCPHCRSVNRVPEARLTEGPNCGQCHAPLFTGHPIGLTAADFCLQAFRARAPKRVPCHSFCSGPRGRS